uniref:MADF domain-containing protein n=1 Tax=Cuerna arida TaxID=1464854 RepID=A0A1B6FVI6_9HEMI
MAVRSERVYGRVSSVAHISHLRMRTDASSLKFARVGRRDIVCVCQFSLKTVCIYKYCVLLNTVHMAAWTKDFLLEFIELFRGEECLWKITSKDYHNKTKREESYKRLVEKVKEIDPAANKAVVTRKINSLRSAFRKELKKVD